MSWDYFEYRWNMMQSVEIGTQKVDIEKLTQDFAAMERVLIYLLGRIALGQRITPDDPVVKNFMRIGEEDPQSAVTDLVGKIRDRTAPKLIRCPRCGSGVRDLEGVHDEVCQWCGHKLSTKF
jgi:DNA-directed RNA polymerase subunit RPC12/RpoP